MWAIEHLDVLACTHCTKARNHPSPSPHPPNLVSFHGNKTCQTFLRFLDNPQLALQDEVLYFPHFVLRCVNRLRPRPYWIRPLFWKKFSNNVNWQIKVLQYYSRKLDQLSKKEGSLVKSVLSEWVVVLIRIDDGSSESNSLFWNNAVWNKAKESYL